MMNVVSIAPTIIDPALVTIAERLMSEIKAGRITALAYIAITPGGGTEQSWGGDCSLTTMAGASHELALTITLASVSNIHAGK